MVTKNAKESVDVKKKTRKFFRNDYVFDAFVQRIVFGKNINNVERTYSVKEAPRNTSVDGYQPLYLPEENGNIPLADNTVVNVGKTRKDQEEKRNLLKEINTGDLETITDLLTAKEWSYT